MADQTASFAQYRFWPGGMDSWTAPWDVSQQRFVYGQNILNKGGIPQTRPGSRSLACMERGNPQGIGMFTPENGVTHLLAAVNGSIFVSPQPFSEWRQLVGLNFNRYSKFVTFTECLKSTDYDADGEIYYLDKPYRVVVIQDGNTRAAFWDGSTYQHLNPTPSNLSLTVDNRDETKIGLWSAYSNNRFWTARGRFVFASDIGNPLKFHESQYLNEAPAFVLQGDCTGIIENPDQSGILCFYEGGADFIQTAIQDRTLWLNTPEFQRKVISVGCVAPKSLISQNGMVYWFSDRGWVNLNQALRSFITSVLDPLDDEMAYSKQALGPDLSRIAAGTIENLSLVSVPFCSLRNTHTWALDSLPMQKEGGSAWASVWTGWNPVAWVSGDVDGYQRIFFLSADNDGHNRVWEGMTRDQKDNGCAITCFVQFRQEDFNDGAQLKRFRFAEVEFGQLAGTVTAMIAVAGSRGWFDRLATHSMIATYERVQYYQVYGDGESAEFPKLSSSRKQARTLRSEEWVNPSACNACGVEGQRPVNFDYAFNVWVGWSGRAAITRLSMVASDETENIERGDCPPDETGYHTLDGGGCSANELYPVLEEAFPKYFATSIQTGKNYLGGEISWEASAFSQISQQDAQNRADCKAFQQLLINSTLGVGIPELLIYTEDGSTLIGDLIDFGYFLAGVTESITVRLVNVGNGILELTSLTIPDSLAFTITDGPGAFSLDPLAFTFLTLTFDGSAGGGESLDSPEIVSSLSASGEIGTPFSYQIEATLDPVSYSASPLPAGLSIDTATGLISGTPTDIAVTDVQIGVVTAAGATAQATLQINITAVLAPAYTPSAFSAGDFEAVYGFRVLVSGYTGDLFTLRRGSDSALMTFAAGYSPDSVVIWLGAATGYVRELFDQSGNGRTLSQTSNALQPIFGFAAPGGLPSMQIVAGTGQYLERADTLPSWGVLGVFQISAGSDDGSGLICNRNNETLEIRRDFSGSSSPWQTYNYTSTIHNNGTATLAITVGSYRTYRFTRGSNATFENPHVFMNAAISLSRNPNGFFSEFYLFNSTGIGNIATVDSDLRTYYSL